MTTGQVIKKKVAVGTKSERNAVCLRTADGDLFLHRKGHPNPLFDRELNALVGKTIICQGIRWGQTLIMSSWEEVTQS